MNWTQILGLTMMMALSACTSYELIIKNGKVYDGTGKEALRADIAIRGDKIIKIGNLSSAKAKSIVDAQGLAVAPGFINMLSWANESLLTDSRSMSDIKQGVTLEVMGEGWSMGPLNETMKKARSTPPAWATLGGYLRHLEQKGIATNVASFVGATTIRINVLGYENRAPNAQELLQMQALVRQAMEEGAMGLGSSLVYPPAFFASTEELIALCQVVSQYKGMYISHLRSEGNKLLEAIDELIKISKEAHLPAEIYHLKVAGTDNWAKYPQVIAKIDSARAQGLPITTNMYTYIAGGTGLDACVPPWAQEGGYDEFKKRLQNPEIRAKILAEMQSPTDKWENFFRLAGNPANILTTYFEEDSLKYLVGKNIAQIAQMRRREPAEVILDLLSQTKGSISAIYFLMDEANVRQQVALPYMTFGSDEESLAAEGANLQFNSHPRAYGNFARLLGKYVREEKIISLSEAIYRLTALPASRLKIKDRGRLAVGYYADIVVFDPDKIQDKATFAQPHQYALGVVHVWVNGRQVLRNGEPTGATPGRAVWGPGKKK
ncbi:MAG: D-aminoacylase [Microscillaceae bacterium]|jgi:N-acyl-D-amino-acid deacylase|nr:D-aminoacylase [Microscillaceae bacterium]